jgi:pimeloyl-ACP methyl ester carboxylesterase
MEKKTVEVGGIRWSYVETNPESDGLWVTFHGYGQDGEIMAAFMDALVPSKRTVNIDLPYHGQTVCQRESLSPNDLSELVMALMKERKAVRCSVLAYSLGGKSALKLVELMPGKIDRVVVMAPDGLWVNPLYHFTVNTHVGRWLYGRVAEDPRLLLSGTRTLRRSGILNPKVERFIRTNLHSKENRQMVMKVWKSFRYIIPDLSKVRSHAQRYAIEILLVVGRHDKIIRPELAKRLDKGTTEHIRTHILDRGHDLVNLDVAQELRSMLPRSPLS